jgi:antitoxin HigA-1
MPRTPIHPGEILTDELQEINITIADLAQQLDVSPELINNLVEGKQDITVELAAKLSQYFGTSSELWLNLQKSYEEKLAATATSPISTFKRKFDN